MSKLWKNYQGSKCKHDDSPRSRGDGVYEFETVERDRFRPSHIADE